MQPRKSYLNMKEIAGEMTRELVLRWRTVPPGRETRPETRAASRRLLEAVGSGRENSYVKSPVEVLKDAALTLTLP